MCVESKHDWLICQDMLKPTISQEVLMSVTSVERFPGLHMDCDSIRQFTIWQLLVLSYDSITGPDTAWGCINRFVNKSRFCQMYSGFLRYVKSSCTQSQCASKVITNIKTTSYWFVFPLCSSWCSCLVDGSCQAVNTTTVAIMQCHTMHCCALLVCLAISALPTHTPHFFQWIFPCIQGLFFFFHLSLAVVAHPLSKLKDSMYSCLLLCLFVCITRPWPAFGRLGLGASSGGYSSHVNFSRIASRLRRSARREVNLSMMVI